MRKNQLFLFFNPAVYINISQNPLKQRCHLTEPLYFNCTSTINPSMWYYIVLVIISEPNVVRNLQATASVGSLTVTWDEPSPGLVDKYTVELRGETKPKQEISAKTATFNSLTPGKQYTVVVVAVSGNLNSGVQKSAETVGHFYTSKSQMSIY